jgi:hypothetical protein
MRVVPRTSIGIARRVKPDEVRLSAEHAGDVVEFGFYM